MMNDFSNIQPQGDLPPQQSDDNRLTADCYDAFLDALDLLYIKSNLSGRLKFLENWPVAGRFVFGDELIGYDHEGTTDTSRKVALEAEAEDRRLSLLEVVESVEKKSVEKSVLEVEYVEALIQELGRDLALLVYSVKIVDRFLPPDPNAPAEALVGLAAAGAIDTALAPRPSDIPDEFANVPLPKPMLDPLDDDLDDIQPISLDPPPSGAPASAGIPAVEEEVKPVQAAPAPPPLPEEPEEELTLEEAMKALQETKKAEAEAQAPKDGVSDAVGAPDDAPSLPEADMPAGQSAEVTPSVSHEVNEASTPAPQAELSSPPPPPPPAPPPVQASAPDTVSVAPRGAPAPSSDPTTQDLSAQARHKALDDAAPIASQKMTFVPSKPKEQARKAPPSAIPVVGEKKGES